MHCSNMTNLLLFLVFVRFVLGEKKVHNTENQIEPLSVQYLVDKLFHKLIQVGKTNPYLNIK